jgi:Glyoxalase/Bleomycin resistance protein/Dioxygenase superfamily
LRLFVPPAYSTQLNPDEWVWKNIKHDRVGRISRQLRSLIQVELGTDDLDALYAEFLARDIPVRVPPRDRGFERSMQLRDPDGFTVEFAEGVRGHNSTATPRS